MKIVTLLKSESKVSELDHFLNHTMWLFGDLTERISVSFQSIYCKTIGAEDECSVSRGLNSMSHRPITGLSPSMRVHLSLPPCCGNNFFKMFTRSW